MSRSSQRARFRIRDTVVLPGRRAQLELPIGRLISGTEIALPVIVVHGATDGPTIAFSAALHGDELCGVEIIRRVLAAVDPKTLSGTIIATPVVNVHGFNTGDRYLPDRRDLNRSFPGSDKGSMAARIANLMMTEVIERASVAIDFHTGSDHRTNLPQIRCDLQDAATRTLAEVFGAPLMMHSATRDGSMRAAAAAVDTTMLLFEGGEALRFDEHAIRVATAGTRRVLHHLGMVADAPAQTQPSAVAMSSRWSRTSRSGLLHLEVELGDRVEARQLVGSVYDPFGKRLARISSRSAGVVIGATLQPIVNRGDAVIHVAEV